MITTPFRSALLVEDEVHLAQALRIALAKLGIAVRHAQTLAQASELLEKQPVELLLLDRMLPDGDGLELCRKLRKQGFLGAILMLTARGDTPDLVEGLHSGADDYLPKPFSWDEPGARIIALSRRAGLKGDKNIAPSEGEATEPSALWTCAPDRLRILGLQGWIELATPLEFRLAARLIGAGGAIVSRDDLLKDVWGFTLLPKTRTVDHFLGRLRKHFEKNPESPEHFLTVRGAGYRFER